MRRGPSARAVSVSYRGFFVFFSIFFWCQLHHMPLSFTGDVLHRMHCMVTSEVPGAPHVLAGEVGMEKIMEAAVRYPVVVFFHFIVALLFGELEGSSSLNGPQECRQL